MSFVFHKNSVSQKHFTFSSILNPMRTIKAERVVHNKLKRIALRYEYDRELISLTRQLPDARWSNRMRCWHISDSPDVISLLLDAFRGKAYIDYSEILKVPYTGSEASESNQEISAGAPVESNDHDLAPLSEKGKSEIARFRRWMEANRYPESTVRTYTSMMVRFLRFVSPREAGDCTSDDLIRIADEYIIPRGLSYSFQNQMISVVKKFYQHNYKSVMDPGRIERPRTRHRLPNVLSKDEVRMILSALTNEKHRVMLSLIYACDLRRSELLHLMPADIEKGRKLLSIKQSKGFKDRIIPVSDKTIEMVETYINHYRPQKYLFEGQWPGKMYSASSLEKVLKSACEKAGLGREISLHWLRHSYATHLLEVGTDLRYIQELLGHKSSRTTEIYTHVTSSTLQKIRSPFDDL